jgi:hypothetical protein
MPRPSKDLHSLTMRDYSQATVTVPRAFCIYIERQVSRVRPGKPSPFSNCNTTPSSGHSSKMLLPYVSALSSLFLGLSCVCASPVQVDDITTASVPANGQLHRAVAGTFSSLGTFIAAATPLPDETSSTPAQPNSPVLPPNKNPIKTGLTSFGDSYGAGMGTGETTTDSCRLGQFSYGNLLADGASNRVFHERRECSGSVIRDVAQSAGPNQIDDWKNAGTSDVVTLSISGNDIGFSLIVDACFLKVFGNLAPKCPEALASARAILSEGAILQFVEITLVQIINKSSRDDLKVFVTGYPTFFNVDTQFCNKASFDFWGIGKAFGFCGGAVPCLTQELRRTVNQLSIDLNRQLDAAVRRVNSEKGDIVRFIDPNPAYNGHRFCEVDDGVEVKEPDPSRADTWFFLSAWPDNKLDGTLDVIAKDIDPALGNENANTTALPPAASICTNIRSPQDYFLCQMARVQENSTISQHFLLEQQQAEIAAGNFSAQHVEWWKPTREIKAFHPRTLGSKAYADLIIRASG